jgi:murein DD-endopeptidase MepM/ murein hydrolase activator NlpD
MKKYLALLLFPLLLFAYRVDIYKWTSKDTFYSFLKKNSLPINIYYDLKPSLKRKVKRIPIGEYIYILKDNNVFKQALIPLNSKIQLQIIKKGDKYLTRTVPIIYNVQKKYAVIRIKHYLSYDVYKQTHLRSLTSQLIDIFKDRVNFRTLPADTTIKVLYQEKTRFGSVKAVKILYASIKNDKFAYNAFYNPYDGHYYDSHGRSLKGMFLKAPLKYIRISSYFGMRFHPILHVWRMHDGIDYVNKVGTPIHAIADGKIIYKGWIKGYGRSVEIKHKYGYISLYAHLHGWPKHLHVGEWVKQGQVIGYLGDTGLSTGPHLHFGLMHNGKWINFLKLKNQVKVTLWGKKRREFLSYIRQFTKRNDIALALK